MKKSKFIVAGMALLVCAALSLGVFAAEDIPPMFGGYSAFYLEPTPEETLILQEPAAEGTGEYEGGVLRISEYSEGNSETPLPSGVAVGDIENSPAIRISTNRTAEPNIDSFTENNYAAEAIANDIATASASTNAGANARANTGANAGTNAGTDAGANVGTNTGTDTGANTGANANTNGDANAAQNQIQPLANDQPDTGHPSAWLYVLGAILLLCCVPVILPKRAKQL